MSDRTDDLLKELVEKTFPHSELQQDFALETAHNIGNIAGKIDILREGFKLLTECAERIEALEANAREQDKLIASLAARVNA